MTKPFSENIIFWDSEFSDLNPYKGELLSVGMVKPGGEQLYLEIEQTGEINPWVNENVMPFLTESKVSRDEAVKQMFAFIGTDRPFMISYVNQFDTVFFYKLLNVDEGTKNFPFHWIQIDFASMLFAMGIDPEKYNYKKPDNIVEKLKIDPTKYRKHHALDDALMLKEIYLKLLEANA